VTPLLASAVVVALVAVLWAGLLALAEEAAVGEAVHALGDPPPARDGRIPVHRALHVARLALLVLAGVGAAEALAWWTRTPAGAVATVLIGVALLFVLGDALPRSVARLAPERAEAALPVARRTMIPFGPLFQILTWADRRLHAAAVPARPLQPELGAAQRDMLLGTFTLADTTVDEIMTPRLDVVGVDLSGTRQDVIEAFRKSAHTRLPVYDGTSDNVVGVLYAKDLVPMVMGVPPGDRVERWQDLVRPAAFVPEAKTLDVQLRDFQRGPAHLAIVVDEFGGTSGLITLEDVLEEIVGEIRDEHDAVAPVEIREEEGRYWVDGRTSLDDLSTALGHPFTHPEVSTVGGLIYSILGRVPRSGEELSLNGYRVVVERVERRRVRLVRIERR
jgi:CBS domain containing-hemolysin-like protein